MNSLLAASGTALWLGILTSISPCPLATNIAAVSYVSKRLTSPKYVLLSGILYSAGRAALYVALSVILTTGLAAAPGVSHFLQSYINTFIGPLLVLIGMVILDLVSLPLPGWNISSSLTERFNSGSPWASFALGMLFALSFCPVSAGLFFGGLLPLIISADLFVALPLLYGIGTGLPVLIFACAIATGAKSLNSLFGAAEKLDKWGRLITGWIFVAGGIYLSLHYIFGINF